MNIMRNISHVKTLQTFIIVILIAGFTVMCVEPFDPPVKNPPDNYLVVDGFLNSSQGNATVRLIRTQPLNDESPTTKELNAQVSVETGDNSIFLLNHQGNGVYSVSGLDLTGHERCRLSVRTSGDKEYQSDFVPIKNTPEIDSISWKADDEGLHFFVNTHDPSGDTRYYRWEYEETFEYTSAFPSAYKYDHDLKEVVYRIDDDVYYCWRSNSSTNILIGTSARLTEDRISEQKILSLPPGSMKHGRKYSLLVKQFAITKEAYDYWQNVKRNTEEIGSIFGVQPSSIDGNIRCVSNPGEPVVGFFSVSSVVEKRKFVRATELPRWRRDFGYSYCQYSEMDTILVEEIHNIPGNMLLVSAVSSMMGTDVIGYTASAAGCVDCRITYGGTNVKPSFWE